MSLLTGLPDPGDDRTASVLSRALRARWPLVCLITAAAVAACWFAVSNRSESYRATAQILIAPIAQYDETFLGLDVVRDSGDPVRTAQTASTLLKSSAAAATTARDLGDGWTTERVAAAIAIAPQGESNVLGITATADDPRLAARLANSFARQTIRVRYARLDSQLAGRISQLRARRTRVAKDDFQGQDDLADQINRLQAIRDGRKDPSLSFSQAATAPGSPTGADPKLLVILALLGGAVIGVLSAVGLEFLNRRVRDESELLRVTGLPVLARVPPMRRSLRRRGAVTPRGMPPVGRESFRMLRMELQHRGEPPRTIMVASATSGDGKTTTAANLAVSLANAGHSVILMDCDLRKPQLAGVLGVHAPRGLVSLLNSGAGIRELLTDVPEVPNLRLLAASEADAPFLEALLRQLPGVLAGAQMLADYVVLDTPPLGEVSDALQIVNEVDDVVLVSRPGHTDRRKLAQVRDVLDRVAARPVGLVVTGQAAGSPGGYYAYGSPAVYEKP